MVPRIPPRKILDRRSSFVLLRNFLERREANIVRTSRVVERTSWKWPHVVLENIFFLVEILLADTDRGRVLLMSRT